VKPVALRSHRMLAALPTFMIVLERASAARVGTIRPPGGAYAGSFTLALRPKPAGWSDVLLTEHGVDLREQNLSSRASLSILSEALSRSLITTIAGRTRLRTSSRLSAIYQHALESGVRRARDG